MKLSVIIPVYNERHTLREVVEAVRDCGLEDLQIVVVDDCSTDGTVELLRGPLAGKIDTVCFHDANLGKGAALRTGLRAVTGTHVVFQDADLEYSPCEYAMLVGHMRASGADAAFGSRFLEKGWTEVSPLWHRLVNGMLTAASNLFTGYRLTDMETCTKLFPASFLKSIELEESQFGIEPEVTAKAAAAGIRIVEVPIAYDRRTLAAGKKIRAKDGLRALYVILKYGFAGD